MNSFPISLFMIVVVLLFSGCKSHQRSMPLPATGKGSAPTKLDLSSLGSERATTLRALRMPMHHQVSQLGAHRLTCSSRLVTRVPGFPVQDVEQQLNLRVDEKGQFAAAKNTSPQYGQEVVWAGGWLYPRLRWSKFLRRPAEPNEPAKLLDRLAGLLPAYVGLLRRFITIKSAGRATLLGREAIRIKLGLEPDPPAPQSSPSSPARSWRRTLAVSKLEGEAFLDARTGVPLQAELTARWKFSAPRPGAIPASGIPDHFDQTLLGETELRFSLKVSDIGKVESIKPPPEAETMDSPRLTRTEIERQMLTGELPLEDKGGAP